MSDYIYHHGIKGQKWGVRRFQNPDGTLTSEGKARKRAMDVNKKHGCCKRNCKNNVSKRQRTPQP